MRGIDVSNWQTGMKPSNLNIDFCIAKATEGIGYTDASCDSFIQDCIANNILWGFYHFARENEPEKEAEYFYNECKNYFGYGIPVLDYETTNYNNREWCERFINRLHELSGVWCLIYISAYMCPQFNGSWIPEKCGLWVAGYPYTMSDWTNDNMPYDVSPFKVVAIWQFTSSLILNGFWEKLDGDIAYMDSEAWMKYAKCEDYNENPAKSIDDLVLETILGEYGIDDERKKMLGDNYEKVQARINELYNIANEVIEGKWGNGWNRENAINGAGYPYHIVQRIVNNILS